MKLEYLRLENFRRFFDLTVNFHPRLTVVVAPNGQGKTSILDAATIALGPFVGAFDLGKSKQIELKDARYQRHKERPDAEQQFPVRVTLKLDELEKEIFRELNGVKNKTTSKDAALLTHYGKDLMEHVRGLKDVRLPVLAYYGSGRLWHSHKNMARKSVLSESRTMAYEDCFSSASSFTQVQQWMSKASFAAIQQKSMSSYESYNLGEQIEGIQNAVNEVLKSQNWRDFHYSMQHEELAMTHPELGVLPVSMLSDGVRAMVSLVADLAWRCAKLNPHLGKHAQQQSEGIVLIDEVDMHLHPNWQQLVISSLHEAFPCIQFVVTTHSPQVLSTVPQECIRVLSYYTDTETGEVNSVAEPIETQSLGVASSYLMAEIQSVDPIPNVAPARWLKKYKSLIVQNALDSEPAQTLRADIIEHFGDKHPEWLECERLIRLQAMKAKLPKRNKQG